jgi:hypothetical protein
MAQSKKQQKPAQKLVKLVTTQRVQAVLLLVLGLLLLNQTVQFYKLKDEIAFVERLRAQNSAVLQDLDQSKQYLSSFGEDLNGIRQFLLLPTKPYHFGDFGGEEVELAEEGEDLTTELFTYIEKLGTYEQNQIRYNENLAAFQTGLGEPYWAEKGLSVDKAGQAGTEAMVFSFKDSAMGGVELFAVHLGYNGFFKIEALDEGFSLSEREDSAQVLSELKSLVESDLEGLRVQVADLQEARAEMAALVAAAPVQAVLNERGLKVSAELSSSNKIYYEFKSTESEPLAALFVEKGDSDLVLNVKAPIEPYEGEIALTEDAEAVLVDVLQNGVDSRSSLQKRVDEQEAEMESVFEDRAFKAVLGELELQFGPKTETETRISYPLIREDGQVLRIIFIDKTSGEVKVEMPTGTDTHTLSMAISLIDLTGKKKLSTPPLS